MRPHQLRMKAFGPFAEETVIDFDAMGDHIYLISGDTGAGKTTIFDGIIYALYGTASGGGRSGLSTEAFHSDYAKQGKRRTEMQVKLVFSNAGRTFLAERRMYWGTGGEAKKAVKESVLFENGVMIASGKGREDRDDVTARVTEILGLDADQFRRIIMLAQGEFQKFLESGSDKRGEILGKLYDNRKHQDFELRLKAANELLKKQEYALTEKARQQLALFQIPEYAAEEERRAMTLDHPELFSVIKRLLSGMDAEAAALAEQLQEKKDLYTRLLERKTQGESQNRLLDDLEQKRQELSEMEAQRPRMEQLQEAVLLAARAEKLIPLETAARKAGAEWASVLNRIEALEAERVRLAEAETRLRLRMETVQREDAPRMNGISAQKTALEQSLRVYDDLADSLRVYEEKKKQKEAVSGELLRLREELCKRKRRQEELEETLLKLEAAGDAAVSMAERRLADLEEKRKRLEELQKEVRAVEKLMKTERELKEALLKAQKAALAAEERHLALNRAFVEGQAGILAEEMRRELKTPGTVRVFCPVCGAEHTAADVGGFAEYRQDIPTEETVQAALGGWNDAKKEEAAADSRYKEKAAECRTRKDALLKTAGELAGISDWEALAGKEELESRLLRCEAGLEEARRQREQEIENRRTKRAAAGEKETVDRELAVMEREQTEAVQRESAAKAEESAAGASVENWRQMLSGYPKTKAEARERIVSLEEQLLSLQGQIDKAKQDYENCLREKAENEGNRKGAFLERENRQTAKGEAEAVFENGLEQAGFGNMEEYRAALSPSGRLLTSSEVSAWILKGRQDLDEYGKSQGALLAAVRQLEESARGAVRVDTAELEQKLARIREETDGLARTEHDLQAKLRSNRSVCGSLAGLQKEREKYRAAYLKLNPLAETANGRYLFSRYVLGDFFHRIIEQANLHLETMTDGEYCLIPKETGDGRKNMGLELKVFNTITGIERDTASLSGGQSFEASLALALGLSDVVQMESASSVRIDSMFIDEGFGSLDSARLDKAIEVLRRLSGGRRQIGIISHVARLDECLPRKIHVIAGEKGSTVTIESDV